MQIKTVKYHFSFIKGANILFKKQVKKIKLFFIF